MSVSTDLVDQNLSHIQNKLSFIDLSELTTVSDSDLHKLSTTNIKCNRIAAKILDDRWKESEAAISRFFPIRENATLNKFREAFCAVHATARASTHQRMNCVQYNLRCIDPREISQMVKEFPKLRSLFNPTSFLHPLLFDHPLTVIWQKLREQNSIINLPYFRSAREIRRWMIQTEEAEQILSQIKKLDLSRCNLSDLPPEIGQLTALKELDLSQNQLTSLPAEVRQLAALQRLVIMKNQLVTLPAEIGQLTALQGLCLEGNQLTSLPAEIGQLTALQELCLGGNQLTSLPAEIGQLALQRLDLSQNQLTALPREIGQLAALKELNLCGNPLTFLPPEINNKARKRKLRILR